MDLGEWGASVWERTVPRLTPRPGGGGWGWKVENSDRRRPGLLWWKPGCQAEGVHLSDLEEGGTIGTRTDKGVEVVSFQKSGREEGGGAGVGADLDSTCSCFRGAGGGDG